MSTASAGEMPMSDMFAGDIWGMLAASFSLSTNIVATTLIAYQAWYVAFTSSPEIGVLTESALRKHRVFIMANMKGLSRRTQVGRTLAQIVESSLLYGTLWVSIYAMNNAAYKATSDDLLGQVFIEAYALCQYLDVRGDALSRSSQLFLSGFFFVMSGCVVPLIVSV